MQRRLDSANCLLFFLRSRTLAFLPSSWKKKDSNVSVSACICVVVYMYVRVWGVYRRGKYSKCMSVSMCVCV